MYLKNKFLIISILLLSTLSSCKRDYDKVPNTYEVFLELSDKNGTNLLNDVDLHKLPTAITTTTEKGGDLKSNYSIVENKNKKILKITTSSLADDKVSLLIFTIQNEALMGNSDKHILNTRWIFSNNNTVLVELSIDGRTISPTKEGYLSYYVLTKE